MWPLRERCSAATQLGAGKPSSSTFHSSGSSAIGSIRRIVGVDADPLYVRRIKPPPELSQTCSAPGLTLGTNLRWTSGAIRSRA